MPVEAAALDPRASVVLTEAIRRIAQFWDLSNAGLGAIIGVSAPTASRLRAGRWTVDPGGKPFELAQLMLRLFRSLDSFFGGDDSAARWWLDQPNRDLGGRPRELIATVSGLVAVSDYVDAIRARV